jgi:hypothetical protein
MAYQTHEKIIQSLLSENCKRYPGPIASQYHVIKKRAVAARLLQESILLRNLRENRRYGLDGNVIDDNTETMLVDLLHQETTILLDYQSLSSRIHRAHTPE